MPANKLKVGVLVSGRGSNLQALLDAAGTGQIQAEIAIVLSNKPDAFALERAKKAGVAALCVPLAKGETREQYEVRLIAELDARGVELVVLAGFMRILSPRLVSHFRNRMINIHPSLLPLFPGLHAQAQALKAGATESGCTVHLVDEGCDTGPILLQARVPVLPNDTEESLSERILKQEHLLLPKAVDLFAKNKVKIRGSTVTLEE